MSFAEPSAAPPGDDEREVLLGYIHWQREKVVATTAGLDEAQLRWTPDDRLLPIVGIVNHLTHMEWRWLEGRYLGSDFPERTDEFAVPLTTPSAGIIEAYWRQGERTTEIVRGGALDAPCLGDEHGRGPVHELLGFDRPVDLRWVLFHVLEETAHHAGHADATREMLDGRRMSD